MSWDRPEKLTPDSEKRELLCSVGGGSTGMWPQSDFRTLSHDNSKPNCIIR